MRSAGLCLCRRCAHSSSPGTIKLKLQNQDQREAGGSVTRFLFLLVQPPVVSCSQSSARGEAGPPLRATDAFLIRYMCILFLFINVLFLIFGDTVDS